MKVSMPEHINQKLPGIILLSHGPFAIALLETANMVFGESENIAAFSFMEGDDVDKYREVVVETLEIFPEGSIVMLDLFGGTPCNQMMRYIQESGKIIEIVSGMNLPMLVTACLSREEKSGKEFCEDAAMNGKDGIIRVDIEGFLNQDDEEDE